MRMVKGEDALEVPFKRLMLVNRHEANEGHGAHEDSLTAGRGSDQRR
jgi:hypothetical protein